MAFGKKQKCDGEVIGISGRSKQRINVRVPEVATGKTPESRKDVNGAFNAPHNVNGAFNAPRKLFLTRALLLRVLHMVYIYIYISIYTYIYIERERERERESSI